MDVVNTNGVGHGALVGFLQEANVDALICGGVGQGARVALEKSGMDLYPGVNGSCDHAVVELLNGTLITKDVVCDHDHGHTCSEMEGKKTL